MGPFGGKPPAHPDFDPLLVHPWNEAHCRVVYHVSEAIYMKDHMAVWGEPCRQSRQRQTAFVSMHWLQRGPVRSTISSLIFSNFFAPLPDLCALLAETAPSGCRPC